MKCEICDYESENSLVVFERQDGIIRCKVCACIARYGRYWSDKELLDSELPEPTKEWKEYLKELE